jgi:hypothetical protein
MASRELVFLLLPHLAHASIADQAPGFLVP